MFGLEAGLACKGLVCPKIRDWLQKDCYDSFMKNAEKSF